jgi:hypothetical protein
MAKPRTSRRGRFAAAIIAVAVGVLASLGATGYAARLVGFSHTPPVAAQYPPAKVTICHHTHSQKNPFVTITVSEHAVPAHLGHGDTVGACTQQAASTPVLPVKPQKMHKAHQSKHPNKGHLHGHVKSAKTGPAGSNRGEANTAKGRSDAPTTVPATTHGKGHGQRNGHDPAHGHGYGRNHGQSQGGHGHGQGPPANRGAGSGGGNGNGKGHKR